MSATTEIMRLVRQYEAARHEYENNQLGPKTDRAWARMERLVARAERLGVIDELIKELS